MAQLSIRIDDDLAGRVRHNAASSGRSMNQYVADVLDAATDPDKAGSEAERLRERLAMAGLLAIPIPRSRSRRPPQAALDRARRAAGKGKALSDHVTESR